MSKRVISLVGIVIGLSLTALSACGFAENGSKAQDAPAAFTLRSNLTPGASIPADYYGNQFGCTAAGESPALEWANPPAGTQSFAVTLFDESAPTGSGFWHYVLIDVPAGTRKIAQGALAHAITPKGSIEMMTDAGKPGFFGPCPPAGRKHTYVYTVVALKVAKLDVPLTSTPGFVSFNLWANELGRASFEVTAGPRP